MTTKYSEARRFFFENSLGACNVVLDVVDQYKQGVTSKCELKSLFPIEAFERKSSLPYVHSLVLVASTIVISYPCYCRRLVPI